VAEEKSWRSIFLESQPSLDDFGELSARSSPVVPPFRAGKGDRGLGGQVASPSHPIPLSSTWRGRAEGGGEVNLLGVYVHVPFCARRCVYCDFNTYAAMERHIPRYLRALTREIEQQRPGPVVDTVFLGGGTPSLLTAEQVSGILRAIGVRWEMSPGAEITIEANPDDFTPELMSGLRLVGVNRLSIGAQCFDDSLLALLGRRHDAQRIGHAVAIARAAGFDNLSLDLIIGLPGQTLAGCRSDLATTLDLRPEHISVYCLTVEPGTPLEQMIATGDVPPPDDDLAAEMLQEAITVLGEAGYDHYEVSNWARSVPGRDLRSQHNLKYWLGEPYVGVGAGAHSYDGRLRYGNVLGPLDYARRIETGQSPIAESEEIGLELAMGETMMLGLRLLAGVQRARFQVRFGVDMVDQFGPTIAELEALGLAKLTADRLALTERGLFLGNEVFGRFLPSAQGA
jgi:oxygen-independent coproporphyrinogen III oxidase